MIIVEVKYDLLITEFLGNRIESPDKLHEIDSVGREIYHKLLQIKGFVKCRSPFSMKWTFVMAMERINNQSKRVVYSN